MSYLLGNKEKPILETFRIKIIIIKKFFRGAALVTREVLETVFNFSLAEAWKRKGWMLLFLKLQDCSLLPSKFLKWRSHLLLSKWHLSHHSLTIQLNKVAAPPCNFSFSSNVWLCIILFSVLLSIWCKLRSCQTFGKSFLFFDLIVQCKLA